MYKFLQIHIATWWRNPYINFDKSYQQPRKIHVKQLWQFQFEENSTRALTEWQGKAMNGLGSNENLKRCTNHGFIGVECRFRILEFLIVNISGM